MPDRTPAWVSEQEVLELISLPEAIDVLERAHRLLAEGRAHNQPRTHAAWDGGILHAVGAAIPGSGVSGTKVWSYTPRGAQPLVVLHSTEDGRLLGLVEALALGQVRTAATSGLGTRLLAREDADSLALIGTGRQARRQALAVAAVRRLTSVRVFGRNEERRAAFAAALGKELDVDVSEHASVAAAVEGAAIVTTVTRSSEPVLSGADLEPGMHVNAVGAITAASRELDVAAIDRCEVVAVDSLVQARQDAGELLAGEFRWDRAVQLSDLVAGRARGRSSRDEITLLRALGIGLADIAVAAEVLRRATELRTTQEEIHAR